jgi:ABC-type multidrug transport system fused ATPase/permease subunit
MEDGVIAEQGTYEQLMQKRGLFYDFAKRQI